jgi:S-adenosylhomocysteine hydrolase
VSFIQDIERMWQAVYNDLQHKNIKLVVILDDGGACITNVPHYIREKYSVVGVEQTSSGLSALPKHPLSFPIIEVASSAAKQLIESPMIAEAVVKKLSTILPMRKESLSCGVAGLGIIGAVVTQKLLSLNHKVIAYDKNSEKGQNLGKALRATDIKAIFEGSKYIFGCTGKDITENLDITDINSAKTFISCSSQDKEFLTLLKIFEEKSCRYQNVLDHLECSLNGQTVKVYRGGFPINLDNSGESVKANDIQLTRALLLGGVLQGIVYALHYPKKKNIRYMLHPAIQSFVVGHWMNYGSTFLFSPALLEAFQDWSWIKSQSRGINQENELISRCFYYENFSIKAPILMRNYG